MWGNFSSYNIFVYCVIRYQFATDTGTSVNDFEFESDGEIVSNDRSGLLISIDSFSRLRSARTLKITYIQTIAGQI